MDIPVLTHLSVVGQLGCFHFQATKNNTACYEYLCSSFCLVLCFYSSYT